ncbi:hypothetical protein EAG14_06640 [Acidovorax sp. 1608163]|uniref:hypothetical protein n=1 Tax=Acidovorax sp. 1608163 TaxID=2478662 RepID=UPI000EF6BD73|nr:hypothetical protein [Acidovorax sp. 1608163]AYM95824.1 hypothetical protein EAG14_06640 [Acidovorax sp. 1608163]
MTTHTTKTATIQDELAQAQTAYDIALETLLKACADFNEGSGKQYAELMQRHADLRGKIATHEAAAETATLEFKQLLAAANFEKTKAVKEALFKKNDAMWTSPGFVDIFQLPFRSCSNASGLSWSR